MGTGMNPGVYTIESVHGFRETIVLSDFRVGPQPSQPTSERPQRVESETVVEVSEQDKPLKV